MIFKVYLRKLLTIALGIAIFSNAGFCSEVVAPTSALSPLAQYLAPHVQTLTRDVWIYHWGPRAHYVSGGISVSGPVSVETDMSVYLKIMIELFENLDSATGDAIGNGLYAAVDPLSSRRFGGASGDFGLLQITIPNGSRILNIPKEYGPSYPLHLMDDLKKKNCPTDTISIFQSTGKCRKILLEALQELKIAVVAYPYFAQFPELCNLERSNYPIQRAFLITGRSMIRAFTQFLTRQIPDGEPRNYARLFINNYAKQMGTAAVWDSSDLADALVNFEASLKEHIFDCGTTYAEDHKI